MRPAYQTGLLSALLGFFATFAIAWLALFLGVVHAIHTWPPVLLLALVVGILAGLFAWLRAKIAAQDEYLAKLAYEIEKLKKNVRA